MSEEYRLDRPLTITCPDCGGALRAEADGTILQYRCHIGHAYTGEAMLAAHFTVLEVKLAACLMALNERAELCVQMANADGLGAVELNAARQEALDRAQAIKSLLESEWTYAVVSGGKR